MMSLYPWHAVQTLHGQLAMLRGCSITTATRAPKLKVMTPDVTRTNLTKRQPKLSRPIFSGLTHYRSRTSSVAERGSPASKLTQKGVDIRLAVDALRYASQGKLDVVVLGVGDADFDLLASAIRELGPYVYVAGFKKTAAKNLCDAADKVFFLDGYEHDFGDWALSRSLDDPWPTWAGSTPVENVLSHN